MSVYRAPPRLKIRHRFLPRRRDQGGGVTKQRATYRPKMKVAFIESEM